MNTLPQNRLTLRELQALAQGVRPLMTRSQVEHLLRGFSEVHRTAQVTTYALSAQARLEVVYRTHDVIYPGFDRVADHPRWVWVF